MDTKYVINYYYDNINKTDKYKYVLSKTVEMTGTVGEIITSVTDYKDGFYFRTNDNLPFTLKDNQTKNVINIYYSSAYREEMYNLAKDSLNQNITDGDKEIFLKILGDVYGDLYLQARNINDVINIDKVDETHLKHLSKLVNYPWSDSLTANEQKESIKFYMQLRRMRGTKFAITNLIRIYGQPIDTIYQSTDRSGVRIIEYYEGNQYNMFPGDIRVEIPEMSNILRDAIEDVKLMGTRLVFTYRLPSTSDYTDENGILRGYRFNPYFLGKITTWYSPNLTGIDSIIDFTSKVLDKPDNKFIYKYRDSFSIHSSESLTQTKNVPYTDLWMFQEYGLKNIRGVLYNTGVIDENQFLYR